MLVVNEYVSADIYCDEFTCKLILKDNSDDFHKHNVIVHVDVEPTADKSIDHRIRIIHMPARLFYRLIDSYKEPIYE